jgi:hypothetical protein
MLYHYRFSTLLWDTLLGGPREPGRAEIEWNTPTLAYADDTDTIKKNTEALLDASRWK